MLLAIDENVISTEHLSEVRDIMAHGEAKEIDVDGILDGLWRAYNEIRKDDANANMICEHISDIQRDMLYVGDDDIEGRVEAFL